MFLIKVMLRLWLVGVHLGLWGSLPAQHNIQHGPQHPSTAAARAHTAAAAPVIGVAARQGRRFAMEDRAVYETGVLGHGRGCGPANYTYAAGQLSSYTPQKKRPVATIGGCKGT